jgi:uncharacterized protein YoaH (UPF0181 family)
MCVHEGPIRGAVRRVRETMPGGVSSGWPQSVSCITYAYTHTIFLCQAFAGGVSSGWPQSVSCIAYAYTHINFLCLAFAVGVSSGWTVKRVCVEVFSFEHSYRIQLRASGANLASLCMQLQHANVACDDFELDCVVE